MSNNIKPCNICGSNSSFLQFCDKCEVQCCQQCLGQHKTYKVCSLIMNHLSPADEKCKRHEMLNNKFCSKCGILLCPLCLNFHRDHIDNVVSLIDAVKKIRREIPKLVKSLSAKMTDAHNFVTALPDKFKELRSVQENIQFEERTWNKMIVERADSLCRQINQEITDFDNDGLIQQQYMRNVGKTIDTIKSIEIVKYSSTFVLLWVCVNKELIQIEENEKTKSLLQSIIFQSGIDDHSTLRNMFGCLKSVKRVDEVDDLTSEMVAKLRIDDQAKVDRESNRIAEQKEAEIQRLNNQIQELTNMEHAEKEKLIQELRNIKKEATETSIANKRLKEEKYKIFKQLCILQDSVMQSTDQSQDKFHQTTKFTDEKSISKVVDVIQTNVSYLNENLSMLQEEICSKEKIVETHCEHINELQQKAFQLEIDKRNISEKYEIVCKEIEDLKNRTVFRDNIFLEEERIKEQEKTFNKKILDLQQKTQQLETEKDILLDKYERVCKERDGFKDGTVFRDNILLEEERIKEQEKIYNKKILDLQQKTQQLETEKDILIDKYDRVCKERDSFKDGTIFKDEIRAKEEVIKNHDEKMDELQKNLQQLGTENDRMLETYEKVCKERDELKNGSILMDEKRSKEENVIEIALHEKIRELQQESQQLKLDRDSCLAKYVNVCKEKDDLIEGSQSIQLSFDEYEARIENLERSLKKKENELHSKAQEFLQQLNGKDSSILELNKLDNRHKATISDQEKTMKVLQKEKDHLQTRQQGLLNQLNQKDNTILEINRMLNHQKSIISDKDETIRAIRMEKDDLQTRLSSVAGEKLTKGNPSITDLGDPNRPMKIGEKYGELYDNEWTDAMESTIQVKKYFPEVEDSEIEEIIIRHLHRLLKCCYIECIMKAEEQIHKLGEALAETMCLTFKSKDEIASLPVCREALVERKAKSEDFAKSLFQNQVLCKNIVADWDYINKSENVMQILTQSTFFEKCVYLCWCMVIQDPVMYLDDDPVSYMPIDKNTYKEFVKSGDSVAYVVWPALFLHKAGPLLFKGVVQAYWKKDEDDNMEGTSV